MITTQSTFRAALFDPEHPVPQSLTDGKDQPAGKRFNVYRNNVIVSLKEALSDSFPVIERLIGAQNFDALAGLFVRAHPPSDPRMMLYGAAFPDFLEQFQPLSHIGYLADVARLELAQRRSYHAADATPIDPSVFSTMSPEILAKCTATFAPALQVLRSSWPVLDIWHFNMTEGAPQPSGQAQDVLIVRPDFDPEMHILPAGSFELIEHLQTGVSLGEALEAVEQNYSSFDFSALLAVLLQTRALVALTPTQSS